MEACFLMVLVIAEGGVNHQGNLSTAISLTRAAKDAGADIIKWQAFTPWRLTTDHARQAVLKGLALTKEELIILAAEARALGIEPVVTPMDEQWLEFCVRELGVKRVKIGSAQAGNAAFVYTVGTYGLPVLISNGMAPPSVFAQAVNEWLYEVDDVTVMSCVSRYPTPDADVSMERLRVLKDDFPDRRVGFSSHCRSFWPSVAAVYAGAAAVEAHLMLPGCTSPDAGSSLLPEEFGAMVREVRYAGRG